MEVKAENWKQALLAQWDEECLISNQDYIKRNFTESTSSEDSEEVIDEIVHCVCPSESLEGLSILYNVSISSIKKRNCLSSNDIYFYKKLIIPQPKINIGKTLQQEKDEKIEEFLIRSKLREEDKKMAIKLLEDTYWRVDTALVKYKKDEEWKHKYSKLIKNSEDYCDKNMVMIRKARKSF